MTAPFPSNPLGEQVEGAQWREITILWHGAFWLVARPLIRTLQCS
jgi:hypothetical protein